MGDLDGDWRPAGRHDRPDRERLHIDDLFGRRPGLGLQTARSGGFAASGQVRARGSGLASRRNESGLDGLECDHLGLGAAGEGSVRTIVAHEPPESNSRQTFGSGNHRE
jgi:hypothetical protein